MALGQTTYNELGIATWGLNETPFADLTDTGNTTGKAINENWDLIDKRFKYIRDANDFNLLVTKPTDYLATYGMWAFDDAGAGEKVLKLEGFQRIDVVATGDVVALQSWVEQYFQGVDWQKAVLDKDLVTSPAPVVGARYIIAGIGGAWSGGTINDIAECTDDAPETWSFTTPDVGFVCEVEDEALWYRFNGASWTDVLSVVQHNKTSGIQGGQANEYYHTNATEHGFIAGIDQSVDTTADVVFNSITGDGSGLTGIGSATGTALTISCIVNEGAGITAGQWVYVSGGSGGVPQVSLGDNTDTTKEHFFGIARETKADTLAILITVSGEIDGLNTNTLTVADSLYCSTAGDLVIVEPTSGDVIHIGHVTVKSATVGKIVVVQEHSHVIGGVASENTTLRMGDNAGANYIYFKDYANNIVASVNSDGNSIFNQINLADGKKIIFGDGSDFSINWNNGSAQAELVATRIHLGDGFNEGISILRDTNVMNFGIGSYGAGFANAGASFNTSFGQKYFKISGDTIEELFKIPALLDKVGIGVEPATANWSLLTVEDSVMLKEVATPANQISGYGKIYFKADHKPYAQGDDATEYDLSGGGGFTTQTLTDQANIDWNMDNGNFATVTLGGNRNFNAPTNLTDGGHYFLIIKQDGTPPRTATFNAVFKFSAGIAPTLSTGANEVDILEGVSDGTNIYCVLNKDFS